MLDHKPGTQVELAILRDGKTVAKGLVLGTRKAASTAQVPSADTQTWKAIGLKFEVVKRQQLQEQHGSKVLEHYRGGLKVTGVRKDGPAASHGIQQGDVLVGLHEWETVNMENVRWVLDHPELRTFNPVKFYVLRGRETLFGHIPIQSDAR